MSQVYAPLGSIGWEVDVRPLVGCGFGADLQVALHFFFLCACGPCGPCGALEFHGIPMSLLVLT